MQPRMPSILGVPACKKKAGGKQCGGPERSQRVGGIGSVAGCTHWLWPPGGYLWLLLGSYVEWWSVKGRQGDIGSDYTLPASGFWLGQSNESGGGGALWAGSGVSEQHQVLCLLDPQHGLAKGLKHHIKIWSLPTPRVPLELYLIWRWGLGPLPTQPPSPVCVGGTQQKDALSTGW